MRFRKISSLLIFWTASLSIIPLFLMFFLLINAFEESHLQSSKQFLSKVADMKANYINNFLDERLADIHTLAQAASSDKLFEKTIQSFYHQGITSEEYIEISHTVKNKYLRQIEGEYYDIFFISLSGDIIFSFLHESDFATNLLTGQYKESILADVFNQSIMVLDNIFSEVEYYPPSNEPASFLAAPVFKEGVIIGVLALQLSTEKLYQVILDDSGLGHSGEAVVAKKQANEILFTTPLKFDKNAAFKRTAKIGSLTAGPMQNALEGKRGFGTSLDYRNTEVIAVWRYLPTLNWGLVVKQDVKEAYAAIDQLKRYSILTLVILTLVIYIIIWCSSRTLVIPIEKLKNIFAEIANGQMERRADTDRSDELGHLAKSFNDMANKLQQTLDTLEHKVQERTKVLEQVNKELIVVVQQKSQTEDKLRLASSVFENTSEGVVITDAKSRVIDCNSAYTEITGYSLDEMLGQSPNKVASGKHDKAFYNAMWQSLNEHGKWRGEIWDRRKNGEVYPKHLSINSVLNKQGQISHYIGVFRDISYLKEAEEKLQNLAFRDALTQLPNRQLFNERLAHEISQAHRNSSSFALMFLDLDQFKRVNDVHGHHFGDELLIEVARRLESCVRENDTVSRLGGDEFTIILTDIAPSNSIPNLAKKIIASITQPILVQGVELFVGTSIGVSIYPDDGTEQHVLVRNADTAMYFAKESGRGNYQFFSEELRLVNEKRNQTENSLREAIKRNEFEVYYQPQINILTQQVSGAEALIRWNHPERGLVSPLEFIPIAEENGMIIDIGTWVFQQVCEFIKNQIDQGIPPIKIAINLSASQFKSEDLVAVITNILKSNKLDSKWIELEITESTVMKDANHAVIILNQLKNLGLTISIDDFGTGYSSLAYLKKFPIDKLKIDREFIKDLTVDKDDAILTSSIIKLAQGLGLSVLAEGAETSEQISFLQENNCQYVQGYFYSKPLKLDDFKKYLLSHQ